MLSYFLLESEKLGAQVRRYTSPSEHPFSDPALLPKPLLSELQYPVTVKPNQINHNDKVMQFYLSAPSFAHAGQADAAGGEGSVHTERCSLLLLCDPVFAVFFFLQRHCSSVHLRRWRR